MMNLFGEIDKIFLQLTRGLIGRWDFLDVFLTVVAGYLGYILIVGLAVLFVKSYKKYLPVFFQIIIAAIVSRGILTEIIRFLWHRNRPFVERNFTPLIEHSSSWSFPSGHASFYFAIASVIYFYHRKLGIFLLVLSMFIGMARVFAGVHWFSDVLAGMILGIASGFIVVKLTKFFSMKRKRENDKLYARTSDSRG